MSDEKNDIAPPKNRYLKKIFKIFLYIILGIVSLNVILYILLSIPAVQKQVIDFALDKLKPIIKTEVSIDNVRLGLFNHVNLKGVYIEDQQQDTLLYAGELDVKINLLPLLYNQLKIRSVDVNKTVINISKDSINAPFNFQFIIDAFTSNDTIEKTASNPMKISIDNVHITNTKLNYNILSEPQTPNIFNANHISIFDFNADINLSSIDLESLDVAINSLSLKEKSGFTVSNLEGKVFSKKAEIQGKGLKLTLPQSTLEINDAKFNIINNEFTVDLKSRISPNDLLSLKPELKNLQNDIYINSNLSGKLPYINVEDLSIDYGDEMSLKAKAFIDNYEKYEESKFDLVIEQFKISPKAIAQFAQIGDSTYNNPELLSSIDYIRMKASLDGYLSSMNLNIDTWTNQGAIQLTAKGSTDAQFEDIKGKASIKTQNFNLIPFTGKESGIERLSMYLNIDLQSTKNLAVKVDGAVTSLVYKNNVLTDIKFKGQYNPSLADVWLNASLPVGQLEAQASMTQGKIPEAKFDIDIHNLMVDRFYDNPEWINPKLTLCLNGIFRGNNIDNMEGEAAIDSLKLWGDNLFYQPGRFTLKTALKEDRSRYISLISPILDMNINGEYSFSNIVSELNDIMGEYLPSVFPPAKRQQTHQNDFNIDMSIKNSEDISKIFELPFEIIRPINIDAKINTIENKINVNGSIPHIRFGSNDIKDWSIDISNDTSKISLNSRVSIPQENDLIQANLSVNVASDTIKTYLGVQNNSPSININGEIKASAHFEKQGKDLISYLNFIPTRLKVGSLDFGVLPASIINEDEKTSISNFGISFNDRKYFGIDGTISSSTKDSLELYFNQAQIKDILAALDINNISAEANGKIIITNTLQQPELYTEGLELADIVIFGDSLGTLSLESRWDAQQEGIKFNSSLNNKKHNSIIGGFVSTQKDSIDIKVNLEQISLNWIQPFVADLLDKTAGSLTAKMDIKGKIDAPIASGWIGFNDMVIGVNYTNVTYHISDTIRVLPDKIGFRDLTIEDNDKNKATVSALISHKNFQNFEYLLNMDLNKFMILNTQNRTDSLFFGKLTASGNVKIKGNENDIDIDMNIRNDKNSNINITIPSVSEASTYKSIVYINTPKDTIDNNTIISTTQNAALPITINTKLKLTPDINLGVVINPTTGDAMHVKGNGDIDFSYNMKADDMKVFGEYTLTEGEVKLKLQNMATLEFKIREGSKLNFIGDPMSTSFNIIAYRRVRASLASLDESFSTSKVNVDCVLGIKGNINKMELTYDVSLPDATDDTRQKIQSIINTDDKKIKQFAYLIATASFYPEQGGSSQSGGSMWTSIASGALSSGLDALLGNMLGDKWEIGTNISSTDGSFSDVDMSINVSTRLFDDKLKLNTNLGYRNDATANTNSNNNLVGDFDIEYELTRLWKLKAYNKTNTDYYRQANMIQGIGIVYTKEARTIKNLFRSFRRRSIDNEKAKTP